MTRLIRLIIVLVLVAAMLPLRAASAQVTEGGDPQCLLLGQQLSLTAGVPFTAQTGMLGSATYCIIIPPNWGSTPAQNDLIVFAHGYVPPLQPEPYIPWDQLILTDAQGNSVNLPAIITGLGYAFATTSYSKNGLAVQEGVLDILNLVSFFKDQYASTGRVFLTGASEGGLVTTLAVERYADVFSGGLATCGPIGDFSGQINYWGDFRAVFDVLFPNLLKSPPQPMQPSTAIYIPETTAQAWVLGDLQSQVAAAVSTQPVLTSQLLSVAKAPIDLANPQETTVRTVLGVLSYNVLATNEGRLELYGYLTQPPPDLAGSRDGNPFSNVNRKYSGSLNDALLNKRIDRYRADQAALKELENYQTSGQLQKPLIVMHTTGDEIVPFWHMGLYAKKVIAQNSLRNLLPIAIVRYGHCAFNQGEMVFAFYSMILKATLQAPQILQPELVLPDAKSAEDFQKLKEEHK
jgi:hypothetical protein